VVEVSEQTHCKAKGGWKSEIVTCLLLLSLLAERPIAYLYQIEATSFHKKSYELIACVIIQN